MLVAGACGAPRPRDAGAPALPRAALLLEPPRIGIGEVATLEIAVVTPPGHALRPLAMPSSPAGIWILGVESLPVEQQAARWLHRTRVRVRAREVGVTTWPGGVAEVEAPDGTLTSVAIAPLAIEVVSVAPDFPERSLPFGAREPRERDEARGRLLPGVALGGALALAGVAVARRLGRRRARRASGAAPPARDLADFPAWDEAREALARARALAPGDPFAAGDAAARALRRYASRRFGVPAEARTSEELAAAPPPFAATTRWPILVSALRELDAHRFRARDDPEAHAALARGVPAALDAALRFVEETRPPGEAP